VGTIDNRPQPAGFRVTNDSTVAVDLQILGGDSESVANGTPGWQLAGTAGPDAYVHRYAVNLTNPTYPGEFGILTTTATDFMSVLVDAFVDLKFALDMPTTTSTLDPQTAPLTVIVLEATP
jgi:hypothetical protein